jgi:FkbM family methyltransferase
MNQLYRRLRQKGISFRHVCEVGVYKPLTSNVIDFIRAGIRATLVEADPVIVGEIRAFFADYAVTVHPVAVWDYSGTLDLFRADSSTFATDLPGSPALANDNFQTASGHKLSVPCRIFSELDTFDIDLLSVDIEGAEWYVLKHLVSRPAVISLETHGKYYINPFLADMQHWLTENKYVIWYKDRSDSVYVRRGLFNISTSERLNLWSQNAWIFLRRQKKWLKR